MGDSTEQTGCFKMDIAKANLELVDEKENVGTIEKKLTLLVLLVVIGISLLLRLKVIKKP